MQASEPWTYHTIKGQGKQLYAGDGILGPWEWELNEVNQSIFIII